MLDALWAFFFGGQVVQQVLVVNSATLSDAYDYRRRFYAATDGEVPTSIQVGQLRFAPYGLSSI